MDIGNALRRTGREDIALRSTIANTVAEKYPHPVNIHSVQIKWKKVFIKTWKALINSELQRMEQDIKKASLEKLNKIGIILKRDIIFRFI